MRGEKGHSLTVKVVDMFKKGWHLQTKVPKPLDSQQSFSGSASCCSSHGLLVTVKPMRHTVCFEKVFDASQREMECVKECVFYLGFSCVHTERQWHTVCFPLCKHLSSCYALLRDQNFYLWEKGSPATRIFLMILHLWQPLRAGAAVLPAESTTRPRTGKHN